MTGKPGVLQSTGSQRVGHNLVTEQHNNMVIFKVFLWHCFTVFHSGCAISYPYWECTRVPISLPSPQHLLFSGFCFLLAAVLMGMRWYPNFDLHFFIHINIYMWKKVKSLSCVQLFVSPWTVAYQPPPSVGFPRQEYWSGLPFPSPDLHF